MTKQKSIVLIVISILLCICLTIGVSYSYWKQNKIQTTTNIIQIPCFDVTLTEEKNEIVLKDAFPVSSEIGRTLTPFTFTITNTCDIASEYSINLKRLTESTLSTNYVDMVLNDGVAKTVNQFQYNSSLSDSNGTAYVLESGILKPGETKNYNLRMWMDENTIISDQTQNKTFISQIVVDNVAIRKPASVSFAEDSWSTIQSAIKYGEYPYQVGDTKCIKLSGFTTTNDNGCENGEFAIRIANTSACKNNEESESACGFVVEFVDIITTYNFNNTKSNAGGYKNSSVRYYLNNTIYSSLLSDLKSVMAETKVISGYGVNVGETSNFTTNDKLYLLSAEEVWGVDSSFETAAGTSRQLDYYKEKGTKIGLDGEAAAARKHYNSTSNYGWLLRTVSSTTDWKIIIVDSSGSSYPFPADTSLGVSPALE